MPRGLSVTVRGGKRPAACVETLAVSMYEIPTDYPEADGTLTWDRTTLVVVCLEGGGARGVGFTYGNAAVGRLVQSALAETVVGCDALAIPAVWQAMIARVRNLGRPGVASMAVAAVDIALWDLKARLLDLPLSVLLGSARSSVPVYGSGGFTSYSIARLQAQLAGWIEEGFGAVKMKIGTDPAADVERVRLARAAIGDEPELFVDANGAYRRKQALAFAQRLADFDVTWFEEPVSSDDLAGLRLLCDRAPPGMEIAAGEYGYDTFYFRRMLAAGAVDVLQIDATRCAGITGFMRAAALADAWGLPVSAHTAPALHVHAMSALANVRPLEYFHDHARIESMLFEGAPQPRGGVLAPDTARAGLGLELRDADASRYAIG